MQNIAEMLYSLKIFFKGLNNVAFGSSLIGETEESWS